MSATLTVDKRSVTKVKASIESLHVAIEIPDDNATKTVVIQVPLQSSIGGGLCTAILGVEALRGWANFYNAVADVLEATPAYDHR